MPHVRPRVREGLEEHGDIVFAKVDTEAEREIAAALRITSIPTLMAFRDGILVFAQPGALPATALAEVIRQVRGLDMAEVRRRGSGRSGQLTADPADPHKTPQTGGPMDTVSPDELPLDDQPAQAHRARSAASSR